MSLGAPLLFTDAGEQIRFRTRKHFALLIRLAVESGRKFTRDYLMDLLWPDVPAPRARHSLAQALTVVKAKVGPEHLIVQRTSIALVPGVVDADVRRLDSCEAEIRGPFLDGFEVPGAVRFEQWKDEWRAKLMPASATAWCARWTRVVARATSRPWSATRRCCSISIPCRRTRCGG